MLAVELDLRGARRLVRRIERQRAGKMQVRVAAQAERQRAAAQLPAQLHFVDAELAQVVDELAERDVRVGIAAEPEEQRATRVHRRRAAGREHQSAVERVQRRVGGAELLVDLRQLQPAGEAPLDVAFGRGQPLHQRAQLGRAAGLLEQRDAGRGRVVIVGVELERGAVELIAPSASSSASRSSARRT